LHVLSSEVSENAIQLISMYINVFAAFGEIKVEYIISTFSSVHMAAVPSIAALRLVTLRLHIELDLLIGGSLQWPS